MKKILVIFLYLAITQSYALLTIDINKQGIKTMPIAVADFSGINNNFGEIIANNLKNSGYFSIKKIPQITGKLDFSAFKNQKIEAIISGNIIKNASGQLVVRFFIYDAWSQKPILEKTLNIGNKIIRRAAHIISDKVHLFLLGEEGFFNSNIAYVSVDKSSIFPYKLEIIDSDGFNPQVLLQSKESIMSPSWSPDNKSLAYVSFASGKSKVYIQHLLNKSPLITLPSFDGIVSSPSWHPDGKSLLVTISKNNNQDIYQYFLNGRLERITTHSAIDTEASFSPDGKFIVWTSNRNGYPAIYLKNLNSGSINKLKISGTYNVSPVFSPNGKNIALVHLENGDYNISEYEIATGDLITLTTHKLNESPSYAPNGKMIIYSYNKHNRSYLAVVATNALFGFKLSDGLREVREPTWSNFL